MADGETPEQFRERMLSIGYLSGGRTRSQVKDLRRPDGGGLDAGQRAKAVTDELGNTVTVSDNRQDVTIRAPQIKTEMVTREFR